MSNDENNSNNSSNQIVPESNSNNQAVNRSVSSHQTSTSALESIRNSQTVLDDHKEQIPENLYLQLSNINNSIYKQNSNNFYRITYTDFKVIQHSPDIYLIRPVIKNEILNLTEEMFSIYTNLKNKSMREKSYYLPTSHNLLGLDLKRLNTNPFVHIYSDCCKKNIDCDCCDESCCEAPETHQISLDYEPQIIKIIKL